jgi:hypothetical protein
MHTVESTESSTDTTKTEPKVDSKESSKTEPVVYYKTVKKVVKKKTTIGHMPYLQGN